MKNYKQMPLFKADAEPPVAIKTPQPPQVAGLIQRQLDELDTCDNWIVRTVELKFKRQGATDE